jgi:hypothetical protein
MASGSSLENIVFILQMEKPTVVGFYSLQSNYLRLRVVLTESGTTSAF